MKKLEKDHNVQSIAFEMLGPPRLSKLLYEAHLLKIICGSMHKALHTSAKTLSDEITARISKDVRLRSEIISIGIPILMPDGKTLLRGHEIKIGSSGFPRRVGTSGGHALT